MKDLSITSTDHSILFKDIRFIIEKARSEVAVTVNSTLVLVNWHIGNRVNQEILKNERAEYGEEVIRKTSRILTSEYGRGYSLTNLFNMVKFSTIFPDLKIVQTLSGKLSWSHFAELIYLDNPTKRDFYAEMARLEHWSVRTLKEKVGSMMFERTSIAKQPEEVIKREIQNLRDENRLTPDMVFRDPYTLDFLNLRDPYTEREFENAILQSMEKFLLELGSDFAFLARQKRITIDGQDYYIDLYFFHRRLRCPVIIELKLGKFKAADKGQVELYLRWIEKYELQEGENSPIGIILCSEKTSEHVELLQLEKSGIRVSQFLTALPSKDVFERELHKSIRMAREKISLEKIQNT
jgi:predicted nuclease of restriction endonuclease-like (RecB) superfamily